MVDTDSGLRRMADRIANNAYWDGPHEMGSALVWFARIPHESGRQEVGRMELTADRLTVRGYAAYGVKSMTQSAAGRYRLTSSSLVPEPKEATSPLDCVVTFEANDQITVDGPATPLLLLLLAHGLLE